MYSSSNSTSRPYSPAAFGAPVFDFVKTTTLYNRSEPEGHSK
jgi:hypothetical protein